MSSKKEINKITEYTIKQNLLLWRLSKTFLEIDKDITKINTEKKVNRPNPS